MQNSVQQAVLDTFLAHLSTKCSWWAIVTSLCPSYVVGALSTFCFKRLLLQNIQTDFEIILQEGSLGDPLPKLLKPFRSVEQDGRQSSRAKNRKTFKRLLLQNQKMDFEIIIQECFLGDPLPELLKEFRYVQQNALRAVNRNMLLTTSSVKSVDRFWNNFTGMFLRWLSTKIAQTVSLHWTRWPPELKIEKPLNEFAFLTSASILK